MKRILIIEDDPLIANIYQQKFNLEGFLVDVAADGKQGIQMIETRKHDLVLLDLMLPAMNGVEVLKVVRSKSDLRFLPIIVFSNCYLTDMVAEAQRAGATQILTKATHTPRQVVEIVCALMATSTAAPTVAATPAEATKVPPTAVKVDLEFQSGLQRSCLEAMPGCIDTMQRLLQTFRQNPDDTLILHELYLKARSAATNTGLAGLPTIARLMTALEALLRELYAQPDRIGPPVLRTISQCVDFLPALCRQSLHPGIRDIGTLYVLVVDPDEAGLRSVSAALEKANVKTLRARTGATALQFLNDNSFDLLWVNHDLPDMPGSEVGSKLRARAGQPQPPVVFATPLATFPQRIQADPREANERIAIPFPPTEPVVKVLTLILQSRIA